MTLVYVIDIENVCISGVVLRTNETELERRIVQANDLETFYRFVNKRVSNRSTIGAIIADSGNILTDNCEKANAFNNYFSSVGVLDNGFIPSCKNGTSVWLSDVLDCVVFSESDVINSINKLKGNLSAGTDGLPAMLFKKLKYHLSVQLTMLFN